MCCVRISQKNYLNAYVLLMLLRIKFQYNKEGSALCKGAQEREGVRGWSTAQKSVLLSITPNHGTENFSALRHD
jgi:hypothetical protein